MLTHARIIVLIIVLGVAAHGALGQQALPTCILSGSVVWPEHDLVNTVVQLFADDQFAERVSSVRCAGQSGEYFTACAPGVYYPMTLVDLDGDGEPSVGDGVGFLGVADANDAAQKPASVELAAGKGFARVDIRITYRVDDQGKPQPIPTAELAGDVMPPRPLSDTTSFFSGAPGHGGQALSPVELLGKLRGVEPDKLASAWAFAFTTPTFEDVQSVARVDPETGTFRLHAWAEEAYVLGVVDTNGNLSFDAGDLVGAYGLPEQGPAIAEPVPPKSAPETRFELTAPAIIGADGQALLPDGRPIANLVMSQIPPVITGTLAGPDVPRVILRLYSDARFKMLVGASSVSPKRPFAIPAPDVVGVYVVALFDADGNGQTTSGDAIGFYGVSDLASGQKPKAVLLTPAGVVPDVGVTATATMEDSGKLRPLPSPQ